MLEIINIDKALTKVLEKHNFEGLSILREEFKRGHYPNVVAKIGDFRKQNKVGLDVEHLLCYMEAISYAEMKEYISSKKIIQKQYEQRTNATSDELIILGQIAFLSDHKLCRRIMSKVVMMCEREGANEIKLARCYMILGEAEENLDKFIRANKYYKKALKHFDNLAEDKYQLILHIKIGQNYAKVNEVEEAIAYLTKARAIAEQKKEHNVLLHSTISLAKLYTLEENKQLVYNLLKEALTIMSEGNNRNTVLFAEVLTDIGYYHFYDENYELAIPFYDQATRLYEQQVLRPSTKLGMIYMQFAYCFEKQNKPNHLVATEYYEKAITYFKQGNNQQLLEEALADVITYFERVNNKKKKRQYEDKMVQMLKAQ